LHKSSKQQKKGEKKKRTNVSRKNIKKNWLRGNADRPGKGGNERGRKKRGFCVGEEWGAEQIRREKLIVRREGMCWESF